MLTQTRWFSSTAATLIAIAVAVLLPFYGPFFLLFLKCPLAHIAMAGFGIDVSPVAATAFLR